MLVLGGDLRLRAHRLARDTPVLLRQERHGIVDAVEVAAGGLGEEIERQLGAAGQQHRVVRRLQLARGRRLHALGPAGAQDIVTTVAADVEHRRSRQEVLNVQVGRQSAQASVELSRSVFVEAPRTREQEVSMNGANRRVPRMLRPATLVNGLLVVEVDDPAWASQLRYLASTVVERLAALAGAGAVTRMEVRVRRS